MNWSAVAALAELLAAGAVVLSLLYLSAQVRTNTRQAARDASRDLVRGVSEVSLAIGASSEMSKVFMTGMENLEQLSPVDQVRFRALCHAMFHVLEQQFLLRQEGTLDDESWSAPDNMLRDLGAMPGIQQYFAGRAGWYTPSFMRYMREDAGLPSAHVGSSFPETYASDSVGADRGST